MIGALWSDPLVWCTFIWIWSTYTKDLLFILNYNKSTCTYMFWQWLSPKLRTKRLLGTRTLDIDYKFGNIKKNVYKICLLRTIPCTDWTPVITLPNYGMTDIQKPPHAPWRNISSWPITIIFLPNLPITCLSF